ncbi:hypothetical protein DSO57_1014977 [Entomophthora muscae]|uniref:Uncharacterized protein n=1 Tax=Entomophthora muscae TaxID=34485 RepID=A0ACC2UR62_9FUNG|nr:hypothetical protein DSO57_1014977 [Entomophthora muscae]
MVRTADCVPDNIIDLPANVSHNTQGALNETPLDASNNMNQSNGNVKLQELSPN